MKPKKGDGKKMKAQSTAQVRATISFPPNVYETLEIIAKQKKVSLAWVVREAAEKYIADKWPLLDGQGEGDAVLLRILRGRRHGARRSRQRVGVPLRQRHRQEKRHQLRRE